MNENVMRVFARSIRFCFPALSMPAKCSSLSIRTMLTAERHRAILRLLRANGSITVAEIAARFNIHMATARRDAVVLADTGMAARSHGGLLPANFFRSDPKRRISNLRGSSARVRIASRAADLLPHEGIVFVDAGPMCLEVGRLLLERPELRICTNSIALMALASESQATLTGIGGEGRKSSDSLTGALALAWLSHLHFDAAVIGAHGLDIAHGIRAKELGECAIKAEVLRRSTSRILVAESEAWNQPSGMRFAPWGAFTAFVTNIDLPREARVALAADKVMVYRVKSRT